jgi:hypothetical protein
MELWFIRKYLNDPTLFSHFCDYTPLKMTWPKLEFPSCKFGLNEVWLKLARRFFPIYICKNGFPSCGPSTIICTSLNLHNVLKLSCKYEQFLLSGCRGEFFQWPHPIIAFLSLSALGQEPGPLFGQLLYSMHPRMICTKCNWNWPVGSGEKDFFPQKNMVFSFCGPSRLPGTKILTNFNLHYVRKLSCKDELFWLSGSWKEDF